jgi:hypothetical protein
VTQLVEDLDDAVRVLVAGLVDEFADDGSPLATPRTSE